MKKIVITGILLLAVILSIMSVNALEITRNSPIDGKTYSQNVLVNLTTEVPAKCSYNFWFPYSTKENGTNISIDIWFGTIYYPITSIFSVEHLSVIDMGQFNHLGFECTDERNNTKQTDIIYINKTTIRITNGYYDKASDQCWPSKDKPVGGEYPIEQNDTNNTDFFQCCLNYAGKQVDCNNSSKILYPTEENSTIGIGVHGYNNYYRYNSTSNACTSVILEVYPTSQVTSNDYTTLSSCIAQISSNPTISNNTQTTLVYTNTNANENHHSSSSSKESSSASVNSLNDKVSTEKENTIKPIGLTVEKENSTIPFIMPVLLTISVIAIIGISWLAIKRKK